MQYTKRIQANAFQVDDATAPVGLSLHVADVYVPELAQVAREHPEPPVPSVACIKLLRPFMAVAQQTGQPVLLQRIRCAHITCTLWPPQPLDACRC